METIDVNVLVKPEDVLPNGTPSPPSQSPTQIDVTKLGVGSLEIFREQHRLRREQRITWLAIAIVGGAALLSAMIILATEYHAIGSVTREHWAIELLTLTLVSSLSFVMGVNSANSPSG